MSGGHIGAAFFWGVIVQDTYIADKGTYIFAFFHVCISSHVVIFTALILLFISLLQFLFFQIPLTVYLAWKADKIVCERKRVSKPELEVEIKPRGRATNVFHSVINNKFFILLIVWQIFVITVTTFISQDFIGLFLSPVKSWCIPLAIFLRWRINVLGNRGL